ncbi:hypothetical protein [Enterococcus sp. DIV0849a]|uniref:hypothetical protein n=1 Tax=unclassified Enterococcus TaxID=2608891 RepID=UPI0030D3FEA3
MEKDEVNKIIQDEGLTNFNLFEKYSLKENEVVIKKENKSWEVFSTSEKGSAETIEDCQQRNCFRKSSRSKPIKSIKLRCKVYSK